MKTFLFLLLSTFLASPAIAADVYPGTPYVDPELACAQEYGPPSDNPPTYYDFDPVCYQGHEDELKDDWNAGNAKWLNDRADLTQALQEAIAAAEVALETWENDPTPAHQAALAQALHEQDVAASALIFRGVEWSTLQAKLFNTFSENVLECCTLYEY